MKIDPTDRLQQLSNQAADKLKKNQGPSGFDSVLQDTIGKAPLSNGGIQQPVQSPMGVLPPSQIHPVQEHSEFVQAEKLLDKLGHYRELLADPSISLKMMHPVVRQMERQAADLEPVMDRLTAGNPLKAILEETIQTVSLEIEKFNTGQYVDG